MITHHHYNIAECDFYYIFTFTGWFYTFMCFYNIDYHLFISVWRLPVSISFKAGLVIMNFVRFYLRISFSLFHIWRTAFSRYSILGWVFSVSSSRLCRFAVEGKDLHWSAQLSILDGSVHSVHRQAELYQDLQLGTGTTHAQRLVEVAASWALQLDGSIGWVPCSSRATGGLLVRWGCWLCSVVRWGY